MRGAFAFSRFPGELPWAGIAQMRNALEGSGDLSAPGQQGWLIGRSLRKMIQKLKVSSLRTVPPPCPNRLIPPQEESGWLVLRDEKGSVWRMWVLQSWKFPVDWKLQSPHAEVQECAGAELTVGPMPKREDTRKRSDAIMSGSFSLPAQRQAPTCPSWVLSVPGPPGSPGSYNLPLPSSGWTPSSHLRLVPLVLCAVLLSASTCAPRPGPSL